jgi:selenocysteine lyase/cysteine desulfurase
VHYYNSEEEVDALAAAVATIVGESEATSPD